MIRVFLSTFFESGEGDGATEEKDCFRFRISCPDSFLEVDEDDSLLEEFELEEWTTWALGVDPDDFLLRSWSRSEIYDKRKLHNF